MYTAYKGYFKAMRRNCKRLIRITIISFIFALILPISVYASDVEKDIISSMDKELSDFNNSLPDSVKDILTDEILKGDFSHLTDGTINQGTFISSFLNSLLANLPSVLNSFSLILISVIISSLFNNMASSLDSQTLKSSYGLCSSLCISLSIFNLINTMCVNTISYMRTLCTVMNGFAPVMTVLHIMCGKISTAGLSNATMMMFIALMENIIIEMLIPISSACLIFCIVKAISGDESYGGLSKFIRNTFVTLTVFSMMIFSFVFSFQSTLTQSVDSLSMKTAKFAIGSFIPIVGPSISEALRTVTSSVGVIKNSCGVIAFIAVLLLTLPVIASLYLNKLSLDICASLSGIIGCEREKGIISDASGICGFTLALTCCSAVFFIFALTIFIKSSVGV